MLAAGQAVGSATGRREAAGLASFALLVSAFVLPHGMRRGSPLVETVATPASVTAGILLAPGALVAIALLGRAAGLESAAPGARPSLSSAVGAALLAPLFEEVLYRERLLHALRARWGSATAVLLSSAAFALPHLRPWALVGTFAVGLGLGALRITGGRLAPCVGLHAGLNLGLAGRLHAPGLPWPAPLESTCAGVALLWLALRAGSRCAPTEGGGRGA